MRILEVVVGGALFAAVTSAPAAAVDRVFVGAFVIESASSSCSSLPYVKVGADFGARFKPGGIGTNGPTSYLSIELENVLVSSYSFRAADPSPASANATEIRSFSPAVTKDSPSFGYFGTVSWTSALVYNENIPDAIKANTRAATLTVSISGFGNVAACTVAFRGALARL